MAWDITSITRDVTVSDPETGEKATVVIHKLSEGDRQRIIDAASVGEFRQVVLERSITSWTIPMPVSADSISKLPPTVAEAIYSASVEFSEAMVNDDPPTETS